ncbi:MAG: hypothetical protein A4E41_01348 [Methanoregulaceae archaeon PtaU1.Bin066]|jgi:hypothetical protein|nr:MAG: hypothetical protein A4E41_01348 [Methanoregulaceae archaeon PtaU1.Bin066]
MNATCTCPKGFEYTKGDNLEKLENAFQRVLYSLSTTNSFIIFSTSGLFLL